MNAVLILVKTARHRYAVRRDQLLDIKIAQSGHAPLSEVSPEQGYSSVELGPLLDPADCSSARRQRALVVSAPRRPIAFLVDEVEAFLEHASCLPLPTLLGNRLQKPWAVGALILDDAVVLQLDLHAVAHSALCSESLACQV